MANQIVLAWDVDVTGTAFGPVAAAAALAAVPLYVDTVTDPVLGQFLGLAVAADVSAASGPSTATRTVTLDMGLPAIAPPVFPCHPSTSTPPALPYPIREAAALAGSFFVENGLTNIPTTATQLPALNVGDNIQFLAQQGVFYEVASVSATTVGLTAPYTGTSGNSNAFKEVAAPVTIAAIYSTSELDTVGVATVPAIPAGSGARTMILAYKDSTGASFAVDVSLTGKRPAAVTLAVGSIDIAEIESLAVSTVGGFGNSVGQITLVELSSALPVIPPNATPGTGIGAAQGDRTFFALTDAAQLLIRRALAYLPPSYFALAQQGASTPQLEGEFALTTNSAEVPTTVDQTAALAAGNEIEFAAQLGKIYTVAQVTPKIVTLTEEYSGLDDNFTGTYNVNTNAGTMGNLGPSVIKKISSASRVTPSPAATPTNAQLSALLGQFVAPETAAPPPNPPAFPATVPIPAFLSGLFTRTLSLALAMPVTARAIAFA